MTEEQKKRVQLSKAEKRLLAEETKQVAFDAELRRKMERDEKTNKLRALRLQRG